MATDVPIWPGSASFYPGDTPFGFYDSDPVFADHAEKIAEYCARRLGYPIVSIELQDINFFTAFEEAVTEYANQVNTYQARDNILHLIGYPTSSINYSDVVVQPNLRSVFKLAKQYGTEAGTGGYLTYYSGSITVQPGQQIYDLMNADIEAGDFTVNQFTIRRIFHDTPPSIVKYYDPFMGTGLSSANFMDQFGWGNMSPPINFTMVPMWWDALRLQAIEFNDTIRKSGYGFQLTNNRLRILPIPNKEFKVWFLYTLDDDTLPGGTNSELSDENGPGKITGHANMPYYNLKYSRLNDVARQWIRKYTLALVKEMLGNVRSKYNSIPIPDGEVQLDGDTLRSDGKSEQESLLTELKEMLDTYSRQALLERSQAEDDMLKQKLSRVPLKIYVR